MSQSEIVVQKPKFSLFKFSIKYLGIILHILFPVFKMLKINSDLKLIEKTLGKDMIGVGGKVIPPYDYLKRQKIRNILFSLLTILPLVVSLIIAKQRIDSNEIFWKGVSSAQRQIDFKDFKNGFGFKKAIEKMSIAKKIDPSIEKIIKESSYSVGFSLLFSFLFGLLLVYRNPIIVNTKLFEKILRNNGYIRDGEPYKVVFTKIGCLIDIMGINPMEIVSSERIWMALNIKVDRDWAENPHKRSMVFIKSKFELKKGIFYGFNRINKEGNPISLLPEDFKKLGLVYNKEEEKPKDEKENVENKDKDK